MNVLDSLLFEASKAAAKALSFASTAVPTIIWANAVAWVRASRSVVEPGIEQNLHVSEGLLHHLEALE